MISICNFVYDFFRNLSLINYTCVRKKNVFFFNFFFSLIFWAITKNCTFVELLESIYPIAHLEWTLHWHNIASALPWHNIALAPFHTDIGQNGTKDFTVYINKYLLEIYRMLEHSLIFNQIIQYKRIWCLQLIVVVFVLYGKHFFIERYFYMQSEQKQNHQQFCDHL